MDHADSIRLMAAEKYLLGELTPELRDQFEEHYFSCQECALDVRHGAAFIDHSKTLLSMQPYSSPPEAAKESKKGILIGWLRPAFLLPALALLLIVVGYQNLITYPRLHQAALTANLPSVLPSVSLISANARGASRATLTVHKNDPFLIYLDVPPDRRFTSYEAALYGPSGKEEWSLAIPSEKVNDTLPIHVPPSHNGAGVYTVVVTGLTAPDQRSEVGRYPFELKVQD